MNRAKKERKSLRISLTKGLTTLEADLADPTVRESTLNAQMDLVKDTMEKLKVVEAKIKDLLLDDDETTDEVLEKHDEEAGAYYLRYLKAAEDLKSRCGSSSPAPTEVSDSKDKDKDEDENLSQKYKLRKMDLPQFSGEVLDWIPFWSVFESVHKDSKYKKHEKFTYLMGCLKKETRAYEIARGYPVSDKNYDEVIAQLKKRFGREGLLLQTYVQELLKLVIRSHTDKKPFEDVWRTGISYVRNLETIESYTLDRDTLMYLILETLLPHKIHLDWKLSAAYEKKENKLKIFCDFVEAQIDARIDVELSKKALVTEEDKKKSEKKAGANNGTQPRKGKEPDLPTAMGLVSIDGKLPCLFCEKNNHHSGSCFMAKKMSLDERRKLVRESRRCFSCLKPGHQAKKCRDKMKCVSCGGNHYQILCPKENDRPAGGGNEYSMPAWHNTATPAYDGTRPVPIQNGQPVLPGPTGSGNLNFSSANCSMGSNVVLQTLTVGIYDVNGKIRRVRAMIDSGSERSYILKKLVNGLRIPPTSKTFFAHAMFGGGIENVEHRKYSVNMHSLRGTFNCTVKLYDQERISAGKPGVAPKEAMIELQQYGIHLSDNSQGEIEILFGEDIAAELYTGRIIKLKCGLTARETRFGWTVGGEALKGNQQQTEAAIIINSMMNVVSPAQLWEMEAIGIMDSGMKASKKEEDALALQHFKNTVSRKQDGRYQVALPWLEGHPPLPSNLGQAEKRLLSATRKLKTHHKFKDYDDVFEEWKDLEIIEEVPTEEMEKLCHYLPHRPVFKESSNTTKIRPVFDASSKEERAGGGAVVPSLNDCLVKGPNLLDQIPNILLRFREDKVAAVADIKKAFLMIEVQPKDRDFLRFLWWTSEQQERMIVYRHCRVVFGVNCSPFLLGAVIEHHLEAKENPENQEIIKKLKQSLYVDNVAASFPDKKNYEKFKETSVDILNEAKFDLRLWESNVDEKYPDDASGVLGVKWDRKEDKVFCVADLEDLKTASVTKKTILSAIARIFDPLGMLSPFVLTAKILLQSCWKEKIKWNEQVSSSTRADFEKWLNDVPELGNVKLSRYLGVPTEESSVHVFCDASSKGYAAVAYLRRVENGNVTVTFIMARSRVSPIEKYTINRLELVSCEIAVRLAQTIREALDWKDVPFIYHSDSSTALAWIRRSMDWGTFVGNRVAKILKGSKVEDWHHVPGRENAADLPSRGCGVREILDAESTWWRGPEWLWMEEDQWPNYEENPDEGVILSEVKKKSILSMPNSGGEEPWYSEKLRRIGSYSGLVKVMGWILRFIRVKFKEERRFGKIPSNHESELSAKEIKVAEVQLWKIIQQEENFEDRVSIKMIQEDGLWKVETRLTYAEEEEEFRKPVVLPAKHYLTNLMIRELHERNCHAGVQFLVNKLRERVWVISARRACKSVISECLVCKRYKANHPDPIMAPLPENRVRDANPFEVTGVDLAGPLYLKGGKKNWIVLYTCAVYRAVHLELVGGLSTELFLMSFRRFIARRGRPSIVYSDNGTNFTGAHRQLKEIDWEKIRRENDLEPIHWIFSPPSAPWWGGWWERLVRTVKELLVRMLGKRVVDDVELTTILCDIEAVINARPLSYIFENDLLIPLTPALFLGNVRGTGVPDIDDLDMKGFQKKYRFRQKLMADLRQRFRTEYLGHLVQRKNNKKEKVVLKNGDVVLIGSENVKRSMWPLGVILELVTGRDGVQRVAKVKTKNGILIRPVQRLYQLETSTGEEVLPGERIQEAIQKTRYGREVKIPTRYGFNEN